MSGFTEYFYYLFNLYLNKFFINQKRLKYQIVNKLYHVGSLKYVYLNYSPRYQNLSPQTPQFLKKLIISNT